MSIVLWLLGAAKWVGRLLEALMKWVFKDIRHMIIVALSFLSIWSTWGWRNAEERIVVLTIELQEEKDSKEAWIAAYQNFIRAVEAQREEARRLDIANKQRVEQQQARTIERTRREYQSRLDDTAIAAQRLRDELAALGSDSDVGAEDLPRSFTARCRAFGAADCNALLASLPDILTAAEDNTSKLIGLQEYVEGTLQAFEDQSAASGTVTTASALSGDGVEIGDDLDGGGADSRSQD